MRPQPTGFVLIIAMLALAAAGKAVLYDTLDPDCFWHLRVAEQLQRDGIGPIVDDISFASNKTPWTPYSWLAELGMKAIWDWGGYRAAIVTQALMMAAFVVFVTLGSREMIRGKNPLAVIISTVFAMFLSLPYLSFRPVTFVIVMLALCVWLLLRDRRLNEQSRAVWMIVPITVIITNCHFFAIIVPIWIGALLIGAMWEKKNIRRYGLMFAATLIACLITPMLGGAIQSMWQYQFSDPMLGGGVIAEFQPFWKNPITVAVVLGWLAMVIHKRNEFRVGEWIWMIAALALYLRLGRFAPVFAPIAAATLARAMPAMSDRVLMRKPVCAMTAMILVIGFTRIALALPNANTPLSSWLNRHGPDTPGYPCAAADFVAAHVPPGRIINEFTWGGYLGWRLGEKYHVLLDGRTQVYSPQFWRDLYLTDNAKDTLAGAGAAAAVIPIQRSRFRAALIDLGWRSAYRDDRAEVLLSPEMNASINP